MKAKVGQVIQEKARRKYARALGHILGTPREAELMEANVPKSVMPKSDGNDGQWFCIDCGELPQNNWQASSHESEKPKHRLAFRNFSSGDIEEP